MNFGLDTTFGARKNTFLVLLDIFYQKKIFFWDNGACHSRTRTHISTSTTAIRRMHPSLLSVSFESAENAFLGALWRQKRQKWRENEIRVWSLFAKLCLIVG